MLIEIDNFSGFCPGVVAAIEKAESELQKGDKISSLGDIMHNKAEMERLASLGLKVVNHGDIHTLSGLSLLIRAHGEPPTTYKECERLNIRLVDATCPVVAHLQKRTKKAAKQMSEIDGQVVILGKHGHPEVVGLKGQIDDAIVVDSVAELEGSVDFSRPIYFLSQTTKSLELFNEVAAVIRERYSDKPKEWCVIKDTICRQVSNRYPHLRQFALKHDVVIFVSGAESSNGKALYEVCRDSNPSSYKIENPNDIDLNWIKNASSVGICGATSTPKWQMEQVRDILLSKDI